MKNNGKLMQSFTEKVNSAVNIPEQEITDIQVKDKKGRVVLSKRYEFVNPDKKMTGITITDESKILSMEKISRSLELGEMAKRVICKEFANLAEDTNWLKECGFKGIGDFGHRWKGWKNVTVTQYARIGKIFFTEDYQVKEGLPNLGISHYIELLKLVGDDDNTDTIEELYDSGYLVDTMSTKTIREKVKVYSSGKLIESSGKELEEEETSNLSEEMEKKEETSNIKEEKEANSSSDIENEENITEFVTATTDKPFDQNVGIGEILSNIDNILEVLGKIEISVVGYEAITEYLEKVVEVLKDEN